MLETISWQRASLWMLVAVAPIVALAITVEGAGWGVATLWMLAWPAYILRHYRLTVFHDVGPEEDLAFWSIVGRNG